MAQKLINRINAIVEKAESRLETAITKTQKQLFDKMQAYLSKLKLDTEGNIIQSQGNRKILQRAGNIFDKAIKDSGYYSALNDYSGAILTITDANEAYFATILDAFTIDAQYLKALQKGTIGTIESLLANEGLEVQLKKPLLDILNQNINSGASLSDLTRQVQEFVKGTADIDGKLMRYSKQISRDTLFNYSSALQESISQNAGLIWYLYQGGIMGDSRDFCAARAGKYFTKAEVESWASQSWQGKRQGTTSSTIFIYRGGYNCLHSLIPVSEAIVPKSAIERAKELGYI